LLGWLRASGASDLSGAHVAAVGALVHSWRGQHGVDVPGLRVFREDGRLRVRPTTGAAPPTTVG
ncbi:MAG: TilS substrate-binding domain-containing protein, partial [Propionicimonas sp.]